MPKNSSYHWLKISQGFKKLILRRDWTKRKFAEVARIHPQDVNKYLAAQLNPENLLHALYEAGEDIEWIKNGGEKPSFVLRESSRRTPEQLAPLLGRIILRHDGSEAWETANIPRGAGIPFFGGNFFCVEMGSDSMMNAEPPLFPGDICIFETGHAPKKGEIVAFHLSNNVRVIKVISKITRSGFVLNAANKFRGFPELKVKKKDVLNTGIFVVKLQLTDDAKRRFGLME